MISRNITSGGTGTFRRSRCSSTSAAICAGQVTDHESYIFFAVVASDSLETAVGLLEEQRVDEGRRFLVKAMKDPRNLEAWLRASCSAPSMNDAYSCVIYAEKQGAAMLHNISAADIVSLWPAAFVTGRRLLEQDFGPGCLEKTPEEGGLIGQCWTTPETRPYMRVLHGLVDFHLTVREYPQAL